MPAAPCSRSSLRLRLLQDSRQTGLPLLPPQVLLGSVHEGEPTKVEATERAGAGWELGPLLGRCEMAKSIARQTESNLTEAEAIRQAKDGDAAAFEYLYRANCRRV